jgi:hypothetical protein
MIYLRTIAAAVATAAWSLAGCVNHPPGYKSPSARSATLTLTGVYPGPTAVVNEKTVVEAQLQYAIADIKSGSYFVFAQAETTTPGVSSDGTFPLRLHAKLTKSEGQLRFSFPLEYVWNQPAIKHPLVVWFYINTDVDKRYSRVLGKVGPVVYSE